MTEALLLLYLPQIVSQSLHMAIVKRGWISGLAIPLDAERFGRTKTVRGFVVSMVLTALAYAAFDPLLGRPALGLAHALAVGAILGFTYMLAELPNSYLKRRLGIASGTRSERFPRIQTFLDKSDSAFGVSLVYTAIYGKPIAFFFLAYGLAIGVHYACSVALHRAGIKESV